MSDRPTRSDINGNIVPLTDEEIAQREADALAVAARAQPAPVAARIYKADIWRRATDAEAALIDAQLAAQPVRMRRLWDDALYISEGDAHFAALSAAFAAAFGEKRAAQLLAPSE